jgi:hypothetical protein
MQFSFYISKHHFSQVDLKALREFATLTQGGSSWELDATPNTQSLFFFLFCVIWAASVGRLKSLPKSGIMLFTLKMSSNKLFFLDKCLQQNNQ